MRMANQKRPGDLCEEELLPHGPLLTGQAGEMGSAGSKAHSHIADYKHLEGCRLCHG